MRSFIFLFFLLITTLCAMSCSGSMRYNVYYRAREVLAYCDSVRCASVVPFFHEKPYMSLAFAPAPVQCADTLHYVEKILLAQVAKNPFSTDKRPTVMRENTAIFLARTYMMLGEREKARGVLNSIYPTSRIYLYMCELNMIQGYYMMAHQYFKGVKKNELPPEDTRLYADVQALILLFTGEYTAGANIFLNSSKNKGAEVENMYRAFAGAQMYVLAAEKTRALAVYKHIIKRYKQYAHYAQVLLYQCFDPLDSAPQSFINAILPSVGTEVSPQAHYAMGRVWGDALEYEKAIDEYCNAVKEDSSLFVRCAKEEMLIFIAQKKYDEAKNTCALAMGKMRESDADYAFFLKKYIECSSLFSTPDTLGKVDCKSAYSHAYALFSAGKYRMADEEISAFLEKHPSVILAPRFRILLSVCRAREYGHGAMLRSMRGVAMLYPHLPEGVFSSKVIKMYQDDSK